MRAFGTKIVIGHTWKIQKLIPEGFKTVKWGVWKNGVHIGSELTKMRAISVIEHWKEAQ